jgi:hypothetical protein
MSAPRRRLQIGLLAAAGLLAFAALLIYASRDNLIRYTLNPREDFASTPQPAPPDYTRDTSWSVREKTGKHKADVFFIYPTTFFSGEFWNAPISNSAVRERVANIIKPLYAAPFAQAANLHLPLYRQAVPYSFMGSSENGRAARLLAYSDVKRAFDTYLREAPPDRPFVIAGYGQGALYGMKLLADMEPAIKARLVAAYLLEVAIPTETFAAMVKGVPLCDTPDQTGCAVIWHSTTQNARGDLPRENALVWKPSGGFEATRGRELACVNPLTWSISGRAGSPDMNLGAARLNDFGPRDVTLSPSSTAADCWNGLLFTDLAPEPIFLWAGPRYRDMFPSAVNPFYGDIRENVARRVDSHLALQASGQVDESGEPPPVTDLPEEPAMEESLPDDAAPASP